MQKQQMERDSFRFISMTMLNMLECTMVLMGMYTTTLDFCISETACTHDILVKT